HHQPSVVRIIPDVVDQSTGHHHVDQSTGHHHVSHVPSVSSGHVPSAPVSYSIDLPKSQQLASTAQISHLPTSSSTIQQSGHQESVGHHQVAHVTIPVQVGIGGGYTSAAFYETAPTPTGVVIPNVPYSSEPIVASDVK